MKKAQNAALELAKPLQGVAVRDVNVVPRVKGDVPTRDAGLPKALTAEEAHALIAAGATIRDRLLIEAMYRTGARASEIAGLRRCEIKAEAFLLRNLKQRQDGHGWKTVYVDDPSICSRLLLWCQEQGIVDTGYVFPSRKGAGALGRDQIRHIVQAASVRAGIYLERHGERRPAWAHVLRHSAAVRWLEASHGDFEFAAEQMGHSSTRSMDPYRAISDERRRSLARQGQF